MLQVEGAFEFLHERIMTQPKRPAKSMSLYRADGRSPSPSWSEPPAAASRNATNRRQSERYLNRPMRARFPQEFGCFNALGGEVSRAAHESQWTVQSRPSLSRVSVGGVLCR
jgi:hypothetical protein